MKHNWQKSPRWANYAATCAFSGNREWFRSEPRSPGWVEVEVRPGDGDANESEWSTITPEGYRQPVRWPKSGAAIVHGQGGIEWVDSPTDHAQELAEALEGVLDRICSREYDYDDFPNAGKALYKYKQSRGE